MPLLKKNLYLKKSNLPNSGKGLFTRVYIPKGSRIVEYRGKLQPWKEVKDQDGHNAYIFKLSNRLAVNALTYKKSFGRYANDARGTSRVKGLRNNAEYEVEGNKVYIEAIRPINKHEEILVDYGGNFWSLIKKINREKKKLAKQSSKSKKGRR